MLELQIKLALRGRLDRYDRALAQSVTVGIRGATNQLKRGGRRQIVRSGLGQRLANALRGTVTASDGRDITKRGIDADPTGRVFSNARVKGRDVDLIEVFERGITIQGAPYLAIPTPAAGGRRAQPPGAYPTGTFRRVPVSRGRGRPKINQAAFVLIHKARKEVWYVLIPRVRLKRRLNLARLYDSAARSVPGRIDRAWDRAVRRLEVAA